MTTAIVPEINTSNAQYLRSKGASEKEILHQHILSLIQNLKTRWFFFHKEGRSTKQLNYLNRAYNALCQYLPEGYDPVEEWRIAYLHAANQFDECEYIDPNTSLTGLTADYFKDNYVQEEFTLENEIVWYEDEEEEDYDGTNVLELMREDEEMLGWQVSATFEEHADFFTTLSNKSTTYKKIATLANEVAILRGSEGFLMDTYRVRQGLERLRHRGYDLKMDDERTVPMIAEAIVWFEDHTDTLENNDLGDLKLARVEKIDGKTHITVEKEVETQHQQLQDYLPQSITPDLSLQLRHQGWTFNRKATVGVGTKDPIQMLYHMKADVFYSFLRLRSNRFPKTTAAAITKPTAYKLNEERKMRVQPHDSVDSYVRMLCLARWHDEVHGTSYQMSIEDWLQDTINFYPMIEELADKAVNAHLEPGYCPKQDQFNVNLFWKEDAFLKKHSYGYHHSKAQ